MDAREREGKGELNTEEGKMLIDQIAEVSKPILILSGGEPLLRNDVFELAKYGTEKGLRMVMGTNGTLITDPIARQLKLSGIQRIAVSLDSSVPERHDEFRGVKGSWKRTVEGIEACRRNDVDVQVNTTVTQQNYDEIDEIMTMAEKLGASNFHLFFLVPTGRGKKVKDISPVMYEKMIRGVLEKSVKHKLNVRPTCAPQFMRIAKLMKLKLKHWSRGCIAGLSYCRVYPTGEVTPCPYLPIKLGNIREKLFKSIWFNSEILRNLRDFNNLKCKCGICEYRDVCGGCRARAYGLTSDFLDVCGGLHEPTELKGDYLAEEPWCTYQPKALGGEKA
jgi:radical SAM protein with 4Fe4S-binding SPASM domain